MPTYLPPKISTAFITFVGLRSQADSTIFKSSPTLAAGDFKVSIDGGALANLATLPTVTPASSKMVKIELSTSETAGANNTVVCSDAAGAEWFDHMLNVATSARQIDDLSTLGGTAQTGDNFARLGAPAGASIAADIATRSTYAGGAVASVTGAVGSVTAGVTVTTNNDKAGYSLTSGPLDAAGVRSAVGLASANLDTQLDALPTNAELTTALGTADDAILAAVAALNNLSSAQAQTAAAAALTAYDPPTHAEVTTATGLVPAAVLSAATAAPIAANVEQINTVPITGDGDATPFGV